MEEFDGLSDLCADEGLGVVAYDASYARTIPGSSVDGDIAFFAELARAWGGPVIEVACGTGRVSWALARAGIDVMGFDLSRAMLARAEAKRAAESPDTAARVEFAHGDMRTVDLGRRAPLVIVPFRAFQHLLEPADQRQALEALRRHLAPGGRLVIDVFDPNLEYLIGAKAAAERSIVEIPARGTTVDISVIHRDYDLVRQRLTEVWHFRELDAAGRVVREERERLALRWTFRHEFRHLFELCGLEVEAEYSDFHRSPPAHGKEQVWVVRAAGA